MSPSSRSLAPRSAAGVFLPQLSTWVRQAVFGGLFLAVVLSLNLWLGELRAGNSWSLWYGGVATLLLLLAALLSARKRFQGLATRWHLGSSRAWLDLHVAGGLVFLLLVLMHSGFAWPRDGFTWLLLGLSVWTVATGLFGIAIQRWVPRALSSGLSVEVLYQRAPELVEDLRQRAEGLAARSGPPVSTLYESNVAARFAGLQPRLAFLFDITGGQQSWRRGFEHLSGRVDEQAARDLAQLERLLRTKIEIDASYTLQRALRWWLWLHVPTSILLLVVVAVHIAANLYY